MVVLAILSAAVLSAAVSLKWIIDWQPTDYRVLVEAGRRAGTLDLYVPWDVGPYQYSPFYAYLLIPLGWIGPLGWLTLHVAAAFAFGSPRITGLLLIAFPFWLDALSGNVIIFVVLAAWWAVKGNPVATGLYLGLSLLMPRPLMVPLAACLLWQRPEWRVPFAGMFAVHAVAVAASGMADEWSRQLFETAGGALYDHHQNLGASQWIGAAWLIVGLPLAAYLVWRGRVGWAGIAASPYLFPYYLLFGILELAGRELRPAERRPPESPTGPPSRVGDSPA